jgi:hypothetical protein
MLLIRKFAIVASAVVALSATGLVFAGTASAATDTSMCAVAENGASGCAYPDYPTPVGHEIDMEGTETTTWIIHPNALPTTIRLQDTSDCMQLETSDSNEIYPEACSSASDQSWGIVFSNGSDGTEWWSFYSMANTNLCLNFHYEKNQLDAATCNYGTDQLFLANPSI